MSIAKHGGLILAVLFSATVAAAESNTGWKYKVETDHMRGAQSKYAMSEGKSEGLKESMILTLRTRPQDGFLIFLDAPKGKGFDCYRQCQLAVRFDNDPILKLKFFPASTGDYETVFIVPGPNVASFLGRLRTAKTLVVEAEFLLDGVRQFEFDVMNLVWQ